MEHSLFAYMKTEVNLQNITFESYTPGERS